MPFNFYALKNETLGDTVYYVEMNQMCNLAQSKYDFTSLYEHGVPYQRLTDKLKSLYEFFSYTKISSASENGLIISQNLH